MTLTLEELKARIRQQYDGDPETILEALEISVADLLNAFEDALIEYRYRFDDLEEEDGE